MVILVFKLLVCVLCTVATLTMLLIKLLKADHGEANSTLLATGSFLKTDICIPEKSYYGSSAGAANRFQLSENINLIACAICLFIIKGILL